MPHRDGGVELHFDFVRHTLDVATVAKQFERWSSNRSVADSYGELFGRLRDVGVDVEILSRPVEV